MSLLLTFNKIPFSPCSSVSIVDFEQVNVYWVAVIKLETRDRLGTARRLVIA